MDSKPNDLVENSPAPAAAAAAGATGRNRFAFASWVFLRLLAVIHLIAFVSFWVQLEGLVGPNGILPATRFFEAVGDQLGASAWRQLPSLSWIFGAGKFLHVLCGLGVVCSGLLFAGIAPALCLILLWLGYLSITSAGQIFYYFQWDILLLETTLLATFLAPWSLLPLWRPHEPPRLARWLLWWLLFRLMFLAGVVKLASGDVRWRDVSALTFHYETQPLPTVLGWYAHQMPFWWQKASCAGMFAIELIVPFFLFAPRAVRHNAALILAGFMAVVALTGNYTFFNFLAVALCLLCLDDAFWASVPRPPRWRHFHLISDKGITAPRPWQCRVIVPVAVFIFSFTFIEVIPVVFRSSAPPRASTGSRRRWRRFVRLTPTACSRS